MLTKDMKDEQEKGTFTEYLWQPPPCVWHFTLTTTTFDKGRRTTTSPGDLSAQWDLTRHLGWAYLGYVAWLKHEEMHQHYQGITDAGAAGWLIQSLQGVWHLPILCFTAEHWLKWMATRILFHTHGFLNWLGFNILTRPFLKTRTIINSLILLRIFYTLN